MPQSRSSPSLIRHRTRWLSLTLGLLSGSIALAYEIPWSSIDGGAQRSQSTNFELRGTLGQVDASAPQQSGSFELLAGFHRRTPGTPSSDPLFANSFE